VSDMGIGVRLILKEKRRGVAGGLSTCVRFMQSSGSDHVSGMGMGM
jgi:hypothetical protein